MEQRSYTEIHDYLQETDLTGLPPLRIVVLRNITVEPIAPYLQYLGANMGHQVDVTFGQFDNIAREALEKTDATVANSDGILVFTLLEGVSWNLARNFPALSPGQLQEELSRLEDYLTGLIQALRTKTAAMILWHGFLPPFAPNLGILDAQRADGQLATIGRLNDILRYALQGVANAYLVDLAGVAARMGQQAFFDNRYWHIGRAPFHRAALYEIAREDFKFLRALKGKMRKCLVLDCDNTLWGGIIGEDGLSGIKLSKTWPGSAYWEFQQEILNLYHRGVILALCSKNNEQDVLEVLDNHPDMLLKREHIATWRINWQNKAQNIMELAEELNIGLDSMVFVDDSDFEINLVREAIPGITTMHLPKKGAVTYRDRLAASGWFDTPTLSAEDRKRGAMYKAESRRKRLKENVVDLANYFASLEMVVKIRFADLFTIPRIAQLTQRTNQFNLTTKRFSEADITRLSQNDGTDVLSLALSDRFGDSGIVGVCILVFKEGEAAIDTLLLSCRVLGRGVEDLFIEQIKLLAQKRAAQQLNATYLPTRKNGQTADFYTRHGFEKFWEDEKGTGYSLNLTGFTPRVPEQFKAIHSDVEAIL